LTRELFPCFLAAPFFASYHYVGSVTRIRHLRIIIVGGGIGGLTTAIALSKVGIDAQVYERAPELREVGAGIGLASNALRALDALGLGRAIRSQSLGGVQGGIRNPKGEVLMAIPTDGLTKQIGAVAVMHRAELLEELAREVGPERLHLGRTCTGFEQDQNGVVARFHNGETARGDALIGADGLRSVVRTQLFGNPPVCYSGYTAWRAVVEFDGGHNHGIGETLGRGRRFGIVPMSRGRVYWFATNNAAEGERDPEGQTKDVLSRLFRGWHEPIETLISATNEAAILRNDIDDMDPLPDWRQGRVALLGDAAHPMTPNLGQGACQAIEDSVVLAVSLKKHANIESALLDYQLRRAPRTRKFVMHSRWLGIIAQRQNPLLCWLRDSAMRATPKRMAARQMKSLLDVEILTASERAMFTGQDSRLQPQAAVPD
jgi:2-polyprenyl-6-methoxyphenol hydroxylase-like FAD-dependent oxidoreductase